MHALAEVVLIVVATGFVTITAGLGVTYRRLRHAVRLVPDQPIAVPLWWLVHPGRTAQLHRRLRRACRSVIAAVGLPRRSRHPVRRQQTSSPLTRVGEEVVNRAIAIDSRLLAAQRLSLPYRSVVIRELLAEVRSVEAAASRVSRLDSVWRENQRCEAGGLGELTLDVRLDAMEAAMAELHIGSPAMAPPVRPQPFRLIGWHSRR